MAMARQVMVSVCLMALVGSAISEFTCDILQRRDEMYYCNYYIEFGDLMPECCSVVENYFAESPNDDQHFRDVCQCIIKIGTPSGGYYPASVPAAMPRLCQVPNRGDCPY